MIWLINFALSYINPSFSLGHLHYLRPFSHYGNQLANTWTMASENGDKLELAFSVVPDPKPKKDWVNLSLRVVAFLATASATLVMAFNKQTKSMVVATIGTNPVTITLTAMFQHTPAFMLVLQIIWFTFPLFSFTLFLTLQYYSTILDMLTFLCVIYGEADSS